MYFSDDLKDEIEFDYFDTILTNKKNVKKFDAEMLNEILKIFLKNISSHLYK